MVFLRPGPGLADQLVKSDLLTRDQIRRAQEEASRLDDSLCATLIRLGLMEESTLVNFIAEKFDFPFVGREFLKADTSTVQKIPPELMRRRDLLPLTQMGSTLSVAMADPRIPRFLGDAIVRCLLPNPAQRPQSFADLAGFFQQTMDQVVFGETPREKRLNEKPPRRKRIQNLERLFRFKRVLRQEVGVRTILAHSPNMGRQAGQPRHRGYGIIERRFTRGEDWGRWSAGLYQGFMFNWSISRKISYSTTLA